jgi:hypothetical protein
VIECVRLKIIWFCVKVEGDLFCFAWLMGGMELGGGPLKFWDHWVMRALGAWA